MAQEMVNFRMGAELKKDPFYSTQNMDRLNAAIADVKAGRNMSEHELIEEDRINGVSVSETWSIRDSNP